jgi:dTDP-4-dehydrorhamnose 3,5-epimerase
MRISEAPLPGVLIVESEVHVDTRGSFTRIFDARELRPALGTKQIFQINFSHTKQRGAIRGLHYQKPPFMETKLVRCLSGSVWDVAVDLRKGSTTFLKWWGIELSPGNRRMVMWPDGCAHGFQALSSGSELLYLHTAPFIPQSEAGIAWNDRRIDIGWPIAIPAEGGLSDRDRAFPSLTSDFEGLCT